MSNKKLILICIPFIVFVVLIINAHSKTTEDNDWKYPGFDQYTNNFYHKQSQINSKNAKNLEIKWAWEIPRRSPPVRDKEGNVVRGGWTPPLVIEGIVYTATFDNQFFALDAKNGNAICKYEVPKDKIDSQLRYSGRGITYHNGSILMTAADCSIYAFDSKDCSVKWTMPSTCENIPGNLGFYRGMNPPLIFGDYLIATNTGGEYGARGFVAAYSLSTKKLLWRWYVTPPQVEGPKNWHIEAHKGNVKPYKDDWGNSSLIGGGTIWGWPAIDTEKGILYLGTGDPSPDLNGATRPGPNLYTDSVVALNISNGKMMWYYQLTSHDLYDHDIGVSIILEEIEINGKKEKIIVAGSKSGYVLVLKANNGKLLYNPVPISIHFNDINDNNPNANLTLESAEGKVICPANNGGVQASPAFADGNIYVVGQNQCLKMVSNPVKSREDFFGGRSINAGLEENSTLHVIDAATGKILWTFFMNSSYRKGSATISGDLVLLGADNGFAYILDRNNGRLLFQLDVGAPIGAPITIGADADGKMRIFVPFGSRGARGRENGIIALGLKESKFNAGYLLAVLIVLIILFAIYKYKKLKKQKPAKNPKIKSKTKSF
ncbi:PQQ-binding-like beta-propeller repeat protein [Candidatus Woesearchaeota archaeon]|nr:PQQ-binding-like beta-propeller repeat protein [Candidatus Woesearchaeota archaeon]